MLNRVYSEPRGTIELVLQRDSGQSWATLGWSWGSLTVPFAFAPETVLANSELTYWRTLAFPRRKNAYLLGRDAGKQAVGRLVGIEDLPAFEIRSGVFNQPVVRGTGPDPIGVSISHCDAMACAVAFPDEHPMGIDVEEIEPRRAAIMERELLPSEILQLEAGGLSPAAARATGWTAKEALSKALRCGMTCPFSLLAIAWAAPLSDYIEGEFKNFGQYRFQSWTRNDLVLTIVLPKRTQLRENGHDRPLFRSVRSASCVEI